MDGRELLCGCWTLNPGSLEEEHLFSPSSFQEWKLGQGGGLAG